MEQIGKVVNIQGDTATIIIKRNSMCGENCASCGACVQKAFKITCENTIGAKLHDSVLIETEDRYVIRDAFIAYILPVLFMIMAYLLLDRFLQNKAVTILLSFAVLFVFFFVLHKLDHILLDRSKKRIRLVKITERSM